MKKISLELVRDALKKAANLKFSSSSEQWTLDTALSAVKMSGSHGVAFAAGVAVTYAF